MSRLEDYPALNERFVSTPQYSYTTFVHRPLFSVLSVFMCLALAGTAIAQGEQKPHKVVILDFAQRGKNVPVEGKDVGDAVASALSKISGLEVIDRETTANTLTATVLTRHFMAIRIDPTARFISSARVIAMRLFHLSLGRC